MIYIQLYSAKPSNYKKHVEQLIDSQGELRESLAIYWRFKYYKKVIVDMCSWILEGAF